MNVNWLIATVAFFFSHVCVCVCGWVGGTRSLYSRACKSNCWWQQRSKLLEDQLEGIHGKYYTQSGFRYSTQVLIFPLCFTPDCATPNSCDLCPGFETCIKVTLIWGFFFFFLVCFYVAVGRQGIQWPMFIGTMWV
jgi:hypothetical protein